MAAGKNVDTLPCMVLYQLLPLTKKKFYI